MWTRFSLRLSVKLRPSGRLLYTNPHPGICDVCQSALGGLFPSGSFFPPRQRFFELNRPGFPGECFICELRLPDHRFRWKHNKLFLLLPEEYGPAFPAIVDCYTTPPT